MDFKVDVKVALIKKNMTMKDLAEELKISTAYLSDIVNGNRKANHVRKEIRKILNLEEGD